MSCNDDCGCNCNCEETADTSKTEEVVISLNGAPEEVIALVNAVAKVAVDYPMAVSGVKKRATEARKGLMDIKKLALDMRKSALEKCNAARAPK